MPYVIHGKRFGFNEMNERDNQFNSRNKSLKFTSVLPERKEVKNIGEDYPFFSGRQR